MDLEERLYQSLKPYCIKLGWIEFDDETKESGEITSSSEVVDWKVLDYDQWTAVEYLKMKYPDVKEAIIRKVVANNTKHTKYMVLKDIVKSPNPARFSHAIAGTLYYKVEVDDKIVMFPIDMNDKEDVGTTTFEAEYKPLTLMRYIRKAIDKDLLIVMPKPNATV